MNFRKELNKSDFEYLKEILVSTGFFYDSEVEIVKELVEENLEKGEEKSGYIFNIAEENGKPIAFTCYGEIPGTESSFDLYWIAVHKSSRNNGIGKILMDMAVEDIKKRGGENIWIETASRPIYEPTRQFYIAYGCKKVAELPAYYGKDDNKVIFMIELV
ncbi:GNAT family N-acetyltransferase [Ancylomarina sp. 16SWW S1-10-2]|uniref:GNAT family N-acetyltransferase n=1 Tax=Ancylomarina sp. 16SWW S1-10-2 TaxID=2499681 RepID=UPI001E3AD875|nr:GNAT family N-acetyltransferase [Ancylomarina sp. 16SWW S1-10-2]